MQSDRILRGEVWIVKFGKAEDKTMAKTRPVVILQNNLANLKSGTTIVAAITSNDRVGQLPVGVKVEPGISGLTNTSYVHLGHIYTIDKNDLVNKIGRIDENEMNKIGEAIGKSLGLIEI
jgi:mRNA interferase MazF